MVKGLADALARALQDYPAWVTCLALAALVAGVWRWVSRRDRGHRP